MGQVTKVAKAAEIPVGSSKVVEAGGKTIAVFNCEGRFYAIENTCKHRGGPLGEGRVAGKTVSCPWHGWEYDVTSGECTADPAIKLQTFAVSIEGDELVVCV